MNFSKIKKIFIRLLLSLGIIYLSLLGLLIFYQDKIIFLPPAKSAITPKNYGVDFEEVKISISQEPQGNSQASQGQLDAWWIPQKKLDTSTTSKSKQSPALLYLHGNAASLSMLAEVASIFHSYGFETLMFDYRNYGDSSKLPDNTKLSEETLAEDAIAAYQWLRKKRPNSKIILWGHSLGSSVAAKLASTKAVNGIILEGSFPSILEAAQVQYPFMILKSWMLHNQFDTLSYVNNRRPQSENGELPPILFIHSEKDTIIPLELGQKIFEQAKPSKQMLIISKIGHNDFPSVHSFYREKITSIVNSWISNIEN